MKSEKIYFRNLDAIRFIAATMVFLAHSTRGSLQYLPIKNTWWEKITNVICNGEEGVSIFFVLSGFLITFLLISEYELTSTISVRNFYIRRILRIWPLYFAVVLISFSIFPLSKIIFGADIRTGTNIFYHLTFLSNFDVLHVKEHALRSAFSQEITWSVSIEEQFYLFWPLLFAFLPSRYWLHTILLAVFISLTFRMIHNNDWFILYFHSLSVLIDLALGGLFAYMIKTNRQVRIFFEKTSGGTHLLLFAVSFSLLLWSEALFNFKYGIAISRLIISLSFAFIISAQAMTQSNSKLNLGKLRFASKWGKYTYGIYLVHPIIITLVVLLLNKLNIEKNNFVRSLAVDIICFILTLITCKLSYEYFELRFLKLKDKFTVIKTTKAIAKE